MGRGFEPRPPYFSFSSCGTRQRAGLCAVAAGGRVRRSAGGFAAARAVLPSKIETEIALHRDLKQIGDAGIAHIAARQELREMVAGLGLPGAEAAKAA